MRNVLFTSPFTPLHTVKVHSFKISLSSIHQYFWAEVERPILSCHDVTTKCNPREIHHRLVPWSKAFQRSIFFPFCLFIATLRADSVSNWIYIRIFFFFQLKDVFHFLRCGNTVWALGWFEDDRSSYTKSLDFINSILMSLEAACELTHPVYES